MSRGALREERQSADGRERSLLFDRLTVSLIKPTRVRGGFLLRAIQIQPIVHESLILTLVYLDVLSCSYIVLHCSHKIQMSANKFIDAILNFNYKNR
jgi:hypothetical protein